MSKIMRLIFVLYLCVAITAGHNFPDYVIDNITDEVAETLSMSKMEVQICFNKTSVNITDLMILDELIYNEEWSNVNSKSGLKVGCLFACLLQKKELMIGTYIDIEKIKKVMDTNNKIQLNAKDTANRNRIFNICIDQVKDTTNECRVILKLFLCVVREEKHSRNMRNI